MLGVASTAFAQADRVPIPADHPDVLALQERSAALMSIQCPFTQTKEMELLSVPLVSTGHFYFQKPDAFRWQVDAPDDQVIISNMKALHVVQQGKEKKLSGVDRKVYTGIAGMIIGVVNGDLMNDGSMAASYFLNSNKLMVELRPIDTRWKQQVDLITLYFAKEKAVLERMVTHSMNGDRTTLEFKEVVLNGTIDPSKFTQP